MTTNRLLMILLLAIVMMPAAAVLYRQSYSPSRAKPETVRKASKDSVINLTDLAVKGQGDSSLVLVEFSDYECQFCTRHATGVGVELEKKFVETGKIRHAFANNPLPMHQNAKMLATAAVCAEKQGKFWEMHDALFTSKPRKQDEIIQVATSLSLDTQLLLKCLENNGDAEKRIQAESENAKALGLVATPGFAIGRVDTTGHVHVETLLMGAVPFDVFQKEIDELLTQTSRSKVVLSPGR